MARSYQPRVALLDIGLPEMDGFEVARRIRQDPTLNQVLLIAMTGYGEEQHQRASSEAGFSQHLVKPVEAKKLLELLAALISPAGAASVS
jgi:CheY-like chemotaxis protein